MTSILKVDNIQNASGTSAISIDSSGYVSNPKRVLFSVRQSTNGATNQNYTTGVVDVNVFDTTEFNIGNAVSISSGVATFTAPIAGYYQFNWMVKFQTTTTQNHISTYLRILEGGSTARFSAEDDEYRVLTDFGSPNYVSIPNSALVKLAATDVCKVMIKTNGDTTTQLRQGARFSGFLVEPV